jgi:hypothetical protein
MEISKILILEANPRSDLSLNDEIRDLEEVIRRSRNREQFDIKIQLAVRSTDLQRSILEFEPNIIHFCGHGTREEGLVFRDKKIGTDALSSLFELFKNHLECVVFNACYSEVQANEIVKHIDYVIGMNQAIRDDAAIAFSIGFYRALGYGRTYEDAFKFGKNAIQLQIVDRSISSNKIAKETRKLFPLDVAPEITITEEHLKPVFKKKTESMNSKKTLYCNLPHLDHPKFIGRKAELQQLLKQINPNYRQHISTVEGIGGVGKTALVLEAAYLCWQVKQKQIKIDVDIPIFDAIIFTSAKKTYLTSKGILKRPRFEETLQEIFRIIADVLNEPSIIMAQEDDDDKQLKLVYESLSKQRTLLIIDNMETISDKEEEAVISFLDALPPPTQAIITSRQRIAMCKSIRIFQLPEKESFQLIAQEAENKEIKITNYQAKMLFKQFGGIPVALIYAVGQRAMGYSLKKILGILDLKSLPEDLALFLFERSIAPLRDKPAYKLLMSMTLFQTTPTKDALIAVAGLQQKPSDVEKGLAQLQQLSLISEEENRYYILSITRQYALDELAKHPEFLEVARKRWIEWYIRFTNKYGGKDWQDWRIKYDYLAQEWENIASVLYWCANQNKYEEMKQIWQNIDRYVDLGCYWRTRRHWWGWLIKNSRSSDLATYVRALSEKAWTLTLMGNDEAERELEEAWKIREYVDLDVQAHLANHIAVHRITQKKYDEALEWLQQQEQLVNEARLEEKEHIRHQVCITYYQAEIAYWKWKNTNDKADYDRAKELFQWAFDQGKAIGWQRFTNYAQNWLSDLLIIEGNLEQAERLLKEGLFIAERNRERRRIGHYQASYARLEAKKNNHEKAREWGKKARDIFDREGIEEDAREIRSLLVSLPSK